MRLALLGCGHIGGSLALALRRNGAVERVTGYDVSAEAAQRARALGMCDETPEGLADAVRGADVVLLAAPVRAIAGLLPEVGRHASADVLVTDVGSTGPHRRGRGRVAPAVRGRSSPVGDRARGGRRRGRGPVRGAARVPHPTPRTDPAAHAMAARCGSTAGAEVIDMDAVLHDGDGGGLAPAARGGVRAGEHHRPCRRRRGRLRGARGRRVQGHHADRVDARADVGRRLPRQPRRAVAAARRPRGELAALREAIGGRRAGDRPGHRRCARGAAADRGARESAAAAPRRPLGVWRSEGPSRSTGAAASAAAARGHRGSVLLSYVPKGRTRSSRLDVARGCARTRRSRSAHHPCGGEPRAAGGGARAAPLEKLDVVVAAVYRVGQAEAGTIFVVRGAALAAAEAAQKLSGSEVLDETTLVVGPPELRAAARALHARRGEAAAGDAEGSCACATPPCRPRRPARRCG